MAGDVINYTESDVEEAASLSRELLLLLGMNQGHGPSTAGTHKEG